MPWYIDDIQAEAPQSAASVVANGIHGKANGAEKNADDGKMATSAVQAEMKDDEDQQVGRIEMHHEGRVQSCYHIAKR